MFMNFIPLRTPAPLLRGLYVANFGSFLMRFWTFSSSSPSTGIKQEAEQKKKSGKFSYLFYFYAGVNISQKNQNYSVRGLRKFQKYSELLKKIPATKYKIFVLADFLSIFGPIFGLKRNNQLNFSQILHKSWLFNRICHNFSKLFRKIS